MSSAYLSSPLVHRVISVSTWLLSAWEDMGREERGETDRENEREREREQRCKEREKEGEADTHVHIQSGKINELEHAPISKRSNRLHSFPIPEATRG